MSSGSRQFVNYVITLKPIFYYQYNVISINNLLLAWFSKFREEEESKKKKEEERVYVLVYKHSFLVYPWQRLLAVSKHPRASRLVGQAE